MRDSKLDRLFLRFRDKGDVRALSRVFDLTSRELLELAAHVTRDGGQAEDLLQATFLIAIERARQYESGRGLMPWLVGILTNEAKLWNRRAARRIEIDRLDVHESPEPSVELEARELSGAVIEALDKLPELYRDVLLRHLRDNKSAGEIARELDRSPGTVRVQIHRGLELLKKSLPAGLVAGAIAALMPRGLAAVRGEVVKHATLAARTLATRGVVGVAGSTLVGGIVLKKIVVCAGVIIVAGLSWIALTSRVDPKAAITTSNASAGQPLASDLPVPPTDGEVERTHRDSADAAAATPHSAAAVDPFGSLRIHAVWATDGLPADGIALDIRVQGAVGHESSYLESVTDARGNATLADMPIGRVEIRPDRSDLPNGQVASSEIKPGEETRVEVTIPAGVDVEGVVLDEHAAPLAGASIWLSAGNSVFKGHIVAKSASDGSFRVRSVARNRVMGARARGYAPTELRMLSDSMLAALRTVRFTFQLGEHGGVIHGVVRDPTEHTVASAEVFVGGAQGGPGDDVGTYTSVVRTLADGSTALPSRPAFVRTDLEGRFNVDDVEAGELAVMVSAKGWPTWLGSVFVEAGGTSSLDVHLAPAVTITGTIRHPDGTPASGLDVMAASCLRGITGVRTRTDAQGHYELKNMVSGDVKLTANKAHDSYNAEQRAEDGLASEVLRATPGAHIVWDATLPFALSISGRALDEQGLPLRAWTVRALPPEGGLGDMCITHPDGGFVFKGCKDTTYRLELRQESSTKDALRAWQTDVRPGGGEIVLRVSSLTRPSAFIRGMLVDSGGRPVAAAVLYATFAGYPVSVEAQAAETTGEFKLGPLIPGRHELSVQARGYPYRMLTQHELAAEQTLDVGSIVLEAPSSLEVSLRRADGRSPVDVRAELVSDVPKRQFSPVETKFEGSLRFDPVDAGSYFLLVRAGGCGAVRVPVILQAGQEKRMELSLEPSTSQQVRARFASGESAGRYVQFTVRNSAAELLFEEFVDNPNRSSTVALSMSLSPGKYEIEMRSDGFRSRRASFEVSTPSEPPEAIELKIERE